MSKINKFIIFLLVFSLFLLPILTFAADLIPCNTVAHPEPCEFKHFVILINNVVKFIFFDLVVPIAAIMFFYAGFLMVTAGGESAGSRTKAKKIFTNTVIGLVIAAAAYLIVHTLLVILGYDGSWIGF